MSPTPARQDPIICPYCQTSNDPARGSKHCRGCKAQIMQADLCVALFSPSPFDAIRQLDDDGDYWSARDLMPLLGYERWERFEAAVSRAYAACKNSGHDPLDHFRVAAKAINGGRWGSQTVSDFRLTRYACYLVAMNGDPRKLEIASAQTYFAVKTREAEMTPIPYDVPRSLPDALRAYAAEVEAREAAEQRAAELEAPAQAWNILASGEGDFSVADAAKILARDPNISIGRDRLFAYLNETGWTYRQQADRRWRAYQRHVDSGRLSELPQQYENKQTGQIALAAPQLRITAKGLADLHRILGGTEPLKLDGDV